MTTRRIPTRRRETRENRTPKDDLERRLDQIIERSTNDLVERARKIVHGNSNRQTKLDAQA
jgi:hypothetical protein